MPPAATANFFAISSSFSMATIMIVEHSRNQSSSTLQFALRSLRHRNYRLFFIGQSLSLIGTWMSQVATGWLIYRITGSAWLLGLVGFSGQLPAFFLAPFAGVWIDLSSRLATLKVAQLLSM